MPELVARGEDRLPDVVLLDVEMEAVQQDAAVRAADTSDVFHRFGGGVHDVLLEAVDDLDIEIGPAFFRDFHRLAHAGDAAVHSGALVFPDGKLSRPSTVNDASERAVAHILQHPGHVLEKSDTGIPDRRVRGCDIEFLREADAVGQLDACLERGIFQPVALAVAHPGHRAGIDLEDVEPEGFDLVHIGDKVGVPALCPVGVVDSDGIFHGVRVGG